MLHILMRRVSLRFLLVVAPVLCLFSPLLSFSQINSDCPGYMAAYWKLDETGQGSYYDFYGSKNASCTVNCPNGTSGKIHGAQKFSRANSTAVNAPGALFGWTRESSFTVELWMKKESACSGMSESANEVLVGRRGLSNDFQWWVGVDCSSSYLSGLPSFVLTDAGGDSTRLTGTKNLIGNQWHHVVAVRDSSRLENRLYVDGKLEARTSIRYSSGFDDGVAAINIGWLNSGEGFHYSGTIDELAIHERALTEQEILSHYYLVRDYCSTCSTPVKIMPVGDSITVGNSSGADNPSDINDGSNWISYRKDLWFSLLGAGHSVDFVGTEKGGGAVPDFDPDHEGHGGWKAFEIAASIRSWLDSSHPDVVLLHAGTCSLTTDTSGVEWILDEIDLYSKDVTVLLARIINRKCTPTLDESCSDVAITSAFNENLEAMAQNRIAHGDKIILVDQERGAGLIYGGRPEGDVLDRLDLLIKRAIYKCFKKIILVDQASGAEFEYSSSQAEGDMWDRLHPCHTGYKKMAALWLKELRTFLPKCSSMPSEITSSPVADAYADHIYSYDVQANGNSAPVFSLTVSPEGMTINPATGEISWMPSDTGTFPVIVKAHNPAGDDFQSFDILVSHAPDCPE